MPTYNIRGIDVDFPFDAYECQLVYMNKVIQSLQNKCNALLESPTGTGKTLCLLCATLAWRKSLGAFSIGRSAAKGQDADASLSQSTTAKPPPIIYTSRTHSQLRQVIQELKRTNYRPKMVVLGSREQLCIHEEVSQIRGKAQTHACNFVRKRNKKRCGHYPRVAEFMKNNPHLGDEPIDIEELVNIGRSCGPCPYYVSRELHKVVDIIFAPYNYLIDRGNRKSLSLEWSNSIMIFDEAHNLESLCAEAASFDLPSGLLTACISEVKSCIDISIGRRENSNEKSCNSENFAILKALLLKLEKRIAEVPIESKEFGFTKPGNYIYQILVDLNITYDTATKFIDIIEAGLLLLEEDATDGEVQVSQKMSDNTYRLETMRDIFKIIFRDSTNAHARFYRVHVREVESHAADVVKGKASRTLSWWCFNPGIAMEEFSSLGVGSIILTSGTLSPMDSFAHELRLEFPVRLENPHVISPSQIWAGVVPVGPSGCCFNSSYRNRDSIEYKQDLGNAIVNFARIVPDGLLVFFPSYYILEQCIGCWKNTGNSTNSSTIWERICRHKQPVVEPRQSSLFLLSIDDYMTKLKDTSTSGAVFFAVCRGKVSEGLDFADHAGRAVVVTGMPFATRTDPKVRLKREYLDEQAQSQKEALTGEDWYSQQATRAVNQAVGRVIRHRHDYGAIIFCDERFAHSNRQSHISLWIQPHIQCYSKFGDVVFSLTRFFRDGRTKGPKKLELIQTAETGSLREVKEAQALDDLGLEKFLSPLNVPRGQDSYVQSLSSLLEVQRGSISSQFGDVLPANRSSITLNKQNQALTLKCSSNLFYNEKKITTGKKDKLCQNCDTVNPTLDEKPSKELLATYSGKKRKLLILEPDVEKPSQTSHEHSSVVKKEHYSYPSLTLNSMKHEKPQTSSMQNDHFGSALVLDETAPRRIGADSLGQKNKGVQSAPVPCGDDEAKGSAFLIQVKEKLSAAEYKDFVEFMKALKSKAMKIGQVLQSIARLFSGPERLPLRKRFKDYIPAKHRPLYEKYLETNDEGSGT